MIVERVLSFLCAMFAGAAIALIAIALTLFNPASPVRVLKADNHTLREANKVLRAQCPARPRLQRGPFEPGSTA